MEREIYLTVAEVALMLRVSKMTVYRMVNDATLDAVRVGRAFRIIADDFYGKYPECRPLCALNADGPGISTGTA
jgi:excisionase family DNA binding protein